MRVVIAPDSFKGSLAADRAAAAIAEGIPGRRGDRRPASDPAAHGQRLDGTAGVRAWRWRSSADRDGSRPVRAHALTEVEPTSRCLAAPECLADLAARVARR